MKIEVTGTKCAKNILYLRKKYCVSRRGLAKLMGMNEYELKGIEEERLYPVFQHPQLMRVGEIFGLPIEDIIYRDLSLEDKQG